MQGGLFHLRNSAGLGYMLDRSWDPYTGTCITMVTFQIKVLQLLTESYKIKIDLIVHSKINSIKTKRN